METLPCGRLNRLSPDLPSLSPHLPTLSPHVLTQLSSSLSPSYLSSPSLLTYIPSLPHSLPVNSLLFTLHLPPVSPLPPPSLPPSPPASYPPALTLISSLTHTSSSYPLTPHLPFPLAHHLSRHSPGHSSSAPRSFPLSPPPPSLSLFLCPSSQLSLFPHRTHPSPHLLLNPHYSPLHLPLLPHMLNIPRPPPLLTPMTLASFSFNLPLLPLLSASSSSGFHGLLDTWLHVTWPAAG
ncbi:unnamed protein product [Closterium sp. NIES-64]|nr:unnamed protein product [Closterium sp. NIES-64]